MKKRKTNMLPLTRFLFLVYLALMLWLLFGRSYGWIDGLSYREMLRQNINLQPLLTIRNYLHVIIHRSNDTVLVHCIINLAGNVVMFIPAGWLLPRIWKIYRNFFQFLATCTAAILLVELTQLLTLLGSFDIDDVILNLIGLTIGYLFYLLTHPREKHSQKK